MLLLLAAVASATPAQTGRICVYRPEELTRINVTPLWVFVRSASGRPARRLTFPGGGRRRCVSARSGAAVLTLRSIYPYYGLEEPLRFWSVRRRVLLRPGLNDYVLDISPEGFHPDAPGWTKTGWRRMWGLWRVPPGTSSNWVPIDIRHAVPRSRAHKLERRVI